MIVVWSLALIGIDKVFNKHADTTKPPSLTGQPLLHIKFTHFCCNGCYSSMFKAVQQFPWLSEPTIDKGENQLLLSPQEAEQHGIKHDENQLPDQSGSVTIKVDPKQIYQVDFVRLDRVLRDNGLRPEKIELAGIPHFNLAGEHVHLCCNNCVTAATTVFVVDKNSEETKQLKLAPTSTEKPQNPSIANRDRDGFGNVVAEIDAGPDDKDDPYKNAVNITAFINGMDKAGTVPSAIKVYPLTSENAAGGNDHSAH